MSEPNDGPGQPDDRMEFTDLYLGIAKAALYHTSRLFFNLLRTFIWITNGTLFEHWNSYKPDNYHKSAHVYDIVHRYKFDLILGQASFEDFLLTHDKFVHPIYLLRDECVLYQVTRNHAIFVQVDDGVDIWRSKYGSFLRQAQFKHAKKVITLPLNAMERLAEELEPISAKLVFIQNTARCGSTLLVRMFEQTDRCVAFCEPDAVNGICKLARTKKIWDKETGHRIVRNLVRLQCKPVTSLKEPPLAYILKMTAPSMEAAPFVLNAFPEARHMFMYRDCIKISQSLAVAAEVMPVMKLVYLSGSVSASGLQFAVSQMGTSSNDFNLKLTGHPLEAGVVLYAITVKKYLKMVQQGMKIKGVRYEDLADNPQYFITQILEYCELPLSLVDLALKATTNDAQSNSPLSMSNLKKKKKNYTMSPAVEALRRKFFTDMNVDLEPAPVLINTITHKSNIEQPAVEEDTAQYNNDALEIPELIKSELETSSAQPVCSEEKAENEGDIIVYDTNQAEEIVEPELGQMIQDTFRNIADTIITQATVEASKEISNDEERLKPKKQFSKAKQIRAKVKDITESCTHLDAPHANVPSTSRSTKVKLVGTLTKKAIRKEETVAITSRTDNNKNTNNSFEILETPTEDNKENPTGGLNDTECPMVPNFIHFDM